MLGLNTRRPQPGAFLLCAATVLGGCNGSGKDSPHPDEAGGGAGAGGSASFGGRVPGKDGYDCSPPVGIAAPADLDVAEVASGFDFPIFVTHAPGTDPRLFVVEQDGLIRIVSRGELLDTPFLDIRDRVLSNDDGGNSEQGLLGLAFHPQYDENGLFYVHYSSAAGQSGNTIVAEYSVSEDENVALPDERVLLSVTQPAGNHNGGSIAFGSDANLYIALGDGGGGYDSFRNGQDPATLLGSILRIDPTPSASRPYTIPQGNLSSERPSAAAEVWDYGLRNPYRFSFDGCTGDLYIGDVGQDVREELNVEPAGEGRKNYGWPLREGSVCTPPRPAEGQSPMIPEECGDSSGLTPPFFDYPHDTESPAIVGGAVYRGSLLPSLRGTAFFADYGAGRLWMARRDASTNGLEAPIELTSALGVIPTPAAIENGADGELYIVSAGPGVLYRMVPRE